MLAKVAPALLAFVALALPGCSAPASEDAPPEASVVFLVRHSERAEDGTNNPHISEAGQDRAALLARMLKDARIDHIYSTDYFRTLETVEPLRAELGAEVEIYDPGDLEGFAARLLKTPGRHLVVGHSDTTPALVEALGGDPGAPYELMEYDRFYVLSFGAGSVHTILLRFGEPGPD